MRRFDSTYRLGEKSLAIPDTFNTIFRDVDSRLHAQEELRGDIEALRNTLIAQTASRIDEYILPALAYIQTIQAGGFMVAPIADNSAVAFEEGAVDIAIDQELKAIFRPTPYVALVRGASADDWAVAQVLGYDAEAGVLALDIVAVSGSAGPHEDVVVTATSGSVMAQIAYLAETRAARNAAIAARDSAQDLRDAVDGLTSTASDAAGAATAAAGVSVAARDKASRWAEEAEDVEVDGGKYSAKHHAAKAAASALAAATFDPGSYYTKAETYSQSEVDGALDAVDLVLGTKANTGDLGAAAGRGVASTADIQSLSGNGLIAPGDVASALAATTPSGGSDWTPAWGGFVAATWTITANRTLANPTGVIPGTTRAVTVKGSSGTVRTMSFGSNFKGNLPTVQVSNAAFMTLFLYAVSATEILVSDKSW